MPVAHVQASPKAGLLSMKNEIKSVAQFFGLKGRSLIKMVWFKRNAVVCGQNSGVHAQSNRRQFLLQCRDANFA
jgi:hypothetical protein